MRGLEIKGVWYDEVGTISPEQVTPIVTNGRITGDNPKPNGATIPLMIVCRSCGAAAGTRCTDTYKGQTHQRKPHRRRKEDAHMVAAAVRALM